MLTGRGTTKLITGQFSPEAREQVHAQPRFEQLFQHRGRLDFTGWPF